MQPDSRLLQAVESIYNWLEVKNRQMAALCETCGKCCDFARFDHHLFVTTPEIVYLAVRLDPDNIRQMHNDLCPYNEKGRCTIRDYRFAACRIFFCKGEPALQACLSEEAIRKFSSLCDEFHLPYRYVPLKAALTEISGDKPYILTQTWI